MRNAKTFSNIFLGAVVLLFFTVSAHAQFSFNVSGESAFFYGYYSQTGRNGFFGPHNIDNSSIAPGGNFASLNGWVGNQDVGELVTGTNAAQNTLQIQFEPSFNVGWVLVQGRYAINPYDTATAEGTYVAISNGILTTWSISARTPIATIAYGKRRFNRGFGLQFSENRSLEYVLAERGMPVPDVVAALIGGGYLPTWASNWLNPRRWNLHKMNKDDSGNYVGPDDAYFSDEFAANPDLKDQLTIDYPPRRRVRPGGLGDYDKPSNEPVPPEPELLEPKKPFRWAGWKSAELTLGIGLIPWQRSPAFSLAPIAQVIGPPWNENDTNFSIRSNVLTYLRYDSSDLSMGVGGLYTSFHLGPELARGTAERLIFVPTDTAITEGWIFLNYNNGAFFLNTEIDWYNRIDRYQRSLGGTFFGVTENTDGSGIIFAPNYVESWRYMIKAGTQVGPAVLTLMYAFMPGPDRRHGILIDRQPFIQEDQQAALFLFQPFTSLMAYRYGSGVNSPGDMSDASVYGVRLDYALAANLVLSGSFLHARRNSHGYGWGFIRPDLNPNSFGDLDYVSSDPLLIPPDPFTRPSSPSIPDNDLGWEAQIGITWKLLEYGAKTLGIGAKVSYWRPGRWFNYACVDRSVINWDVPSPANNFGANPDRYINPVIGVEIALGAGI